MAKCVHVVFKGGPGDGGTATAGPDDATVTYINVNGPVEYTITPEQQLIDGKWHFIATL